MKKLLVLLMVPVLLAPLNVYAGGSCYSDAEAEADQGIRIHSELMVIGLNCQHMGKRHGQNLYGTYRQFTADHGDLFAKYEAILIDFFKRGGAQNPVMSLNDLRTKYANKISNDAAKMRPDIFCAKYSPRVLQAADMKQEDVRKWAATIFPEHPVSHPLCAG
jgi:hypothetical protein